MGLVSLSVFCSNWVQVMSVVQMVYARFVLTPKK